MSDDTLHNDASAAPDEEQRSSRNSKARPVVESGWLAKLFSRMALPVLCFFVFWSLDVKVADQLKRRIETEAKTLFDVLFIVLAMVWLPLVVMLFTVTSASAAYLIWGGSFTLMLMWGSATILIMYLLLLSVLVVQLWAILDEKNKILPVLNGIGQIATQIVFWNLLFLGTLLEFKPTLSHEKLEMFVGMVAVEIGVMALHKFFRTKIRIAVAIWGLILGANWFLGLLMGVDLLHYGIAEAKDKWSLSSLPAYQQIVDINGDSRIDSIDVALVNTWIGDTSLIRYQLVDGMRMPKGDFDGDFDVDSLDGWQYRQWLEDSLKYPGPSSISQRKAYLKPDQRTVPIIDTIGTGDSQNPTDTAGTTQDSTAVDSTNVPHQPNPPKPPDNGRLVDAQYASVTEPAFSSVKLVNNSIEPDYAVRVTNLCRTADGKIEVTLEFSEAAENANHGYRRIQELGIGLATKLFVEGYDSQDRPHRKFSRVTSAEIERAFTNAYEPVELNEPTRALSGKKATLLALLVFDDPGTFSGGIYSVLLHFVDHNARQWDGRIDPKWIIETKQIS